MWLTGRLTPDFKTIADLQGQRVSDQGDLPLVRNALPTAGLVLRGGDRDRR
jgi:hypothetical protein